MFDYYAYLRTSPIAKACRGFEHHFTSRSRNSGRQMKVALHRLDDGEHGFDEYSDTSSRRVRPHRMLGMPTRRLD
jgi:hypothetical protein